jgi:hypothetical protein
MMITDIRFHRNDIVLDFNGGPFRKHRFLSHISVGMGTATTPLANNGGSIPSGTRIILQFTSGIPNLSGQQVEALLKPLIDFGARSPAEAYAETLPPFLHQAIDQHRVLVGMDRDMVLYAKGEPIHKFRETGANGSSVAIWMYGEPPNPVEFVRFNGPFVVRDELARVGEPVLVRTANEMHDYWGRNPLSAPNVHTIELGDPSATDVALQSARRPAPTLRNPGEKLPGDNNRNVPAMGPVNFPKDEQQPGDPGDTSPPPTSGSAPQPSAQNPSGPVPPPASQRP